jgi:hypothetical protein
MMPLMVIVGLCDLLANVVPRVGAEVNVTSPRMVRDWPGCGRQPA